jgi:hypothetical protein
MRAVVLNCTLKPTPEPSNTEALARVVMEALEGEGIATELVRVVDYDVKPGGSSDEANGDAWPAIHSYLDSGEGKHRSHSTDAQRPRTSPRRARTLVEKPIPAPPS